MPFFRLGKADSVPRGAPGRLPTAYGSLCTAADQWEKALLAEESARKAQGDRDLRREVRESAAHREQPLVQKLVEMGYMKSSERLTDKVLSFFRTQPDSAQASQSVTVSK